MDTFLPCKSTSISRHPISVYCDNKYFISIAQNPTFHKRTKHIKIDCHLVWDKLQADITHLLLVNMYYI
ncbi:hypothetical protein CR513_62046, partial [Mucuna pruriens]